MPTQQKKLTGIVIFFFASCLSFAQQEVLPSNTNSAPVEGVIQPEVPTSPSAPNSIETPREVNSAQPELNSKPDPNEEVVVPPPFKG